MSKRTKLPAGPKQKKNRPTRGLVLGRFQPFHNGHLELVRQILQECSEAIIAIGSAQFNYIEKDPFTSGERVLMVHHALVESGIDLARCYIIPLANDENNARWLAYLKSMVPQFDYVYSGNGLVRHLALSQDSHAKVRVPKFVKKKDYNGTYIRKLISSGSNSRWRKMVPPSVGKIIDEVGGAERIRMLSCTDSNPQRW